MARTREEYLAAERARSKTDARRAQKHRRYHALTKEERAEKYRQKQLANPPSTEKLARQRAACKAWRDAHPGYQAEKMRAYWNTEKGRAVIKASSDKAREHRIKQVNDLKRNPCTDCGGIFHPSAMEYDHRNPEDKCAAPSQARWLRWDFYLAEITKCDLVCANCHRVRTARRHDGLPATLPEPEYFI